ncbi:MAG: ribosome silencing factor [Nitrospiraceae bacterium]
MCIRRPLIIPESKARAVVIAQASVEKKANDVLILHVAPLTSIADYLVLCSGESDRQVRAISDHVQAVLSDLGVKPLSVEGLPTSQWILMDFGDVVVHVFRSDIREHYGLEKLWSDAKRVRLPAQQPVATMTPLRPVKTRTTRVREQRR